MTLRVNGFARDGRLGQFQGENAIATVAVKSGSAANARLRVESTGVIVPLADFKRLYCVDVTKDIAADITGFQIGTDDANAPITYTGKNSTVQARTFRSKEYLTDAEYTSAWAAQENFKRVIDTVQQRAVIIAVSKSGTPAGATDMKAANGWSVDLAGDGTATFVDSVSFLVERATVFDQMRPNSYGQPQPVVAGKELVDDIAKLPLIAIDGTTAVPAPTYSVKISKEIPQVRV